MYLLRTSFLLLFVSLFMRASARQTTVLKGTIYARNSKVLYLQPRTQSSHSEKKIEIPIHDGHFEYLMQGSGLKAYQLIFKDEFESGAWRPVLFFSDTTEVVFHLYPMNEFDKNRIGGGNVNREFYQLKEDQERLFRGRQEQLTAEEYALKQKALFFSKDYNTLQDKAGKAEDVNERQGYYEQMNHLNRVGNHLSPEGMVWSKHNDSLQRDIIRWKYQQIARHSSFAYYYVLFEDVMFNATGNPLVVNAIKQNYQKYVDAYPQHEYTRLILDGLSGLLQVFPGNPYIEFSAPDLQGKEQKISGLVNGKMALIDLWGSWCGPCIAKSRKVVPLYEKYRNKGFVVIGVAREFGNTKELIKRLKAEEFNWPHLVELDDKNGIWNKYGIQNNAGLFVLIGADGKILAIDPTTEELTQYLAKLD